MLWLGLLALIGAQIAYPLVTGDARATLVVCTVLLGFILSVAHALATRGVRVGASLVAVTAAGGLAIEAVGVATGFPFGSYVYGDALGPKLLDVPLVVPLAWTWMAWPAWLVAGRLARWLTRPRAAVTARSAVAPRTAAAVPATRPDSRGTALRIAIAGLALAGWDLFLDPQMVAQGYWTWYPGTDPGLPGEFNIPAANYLGWLGVALVMMFVFAAVAGPRAAGPAPSRGGLFGRGRDAPMLGLYLWTYYSSVLAHALFLGLPASAWWGGAVMGLVAVPLTAVLIAPLWMAPFGPAPARR
jgi:uncharacterized membrane protein